MIKQNNYLLLQLQLKNNDYYPYSHLDQLNTALESLLSFFNDGGSEHLSFIKKSDFYEIGVNSDQTLQCIAGNICFIYYPLVFAENLNDYGCEYYKYLTSQNSFRISKQNFIDIAQKWNTALKNQIPFMLCWTDQQGMSHVESFQQEQEMDQQVQMLLENNMVINEESYARIHNVAEIQRIEPQTFYIKAFKQNWQDEYRYSSVGITPQHGVGELLRFFHQFAHEEQLLEQDSLFMKSLSTIPQLNILGLDRIATASADSPICYLYAWQNPSLSQDIFDEQLIPYFTSQNSLKLFKKNLPDIFNTWRQILIDLPDCVLIWQDKQEWIHIESFADEQRMNERIKQL